MATIIVIDEYDFYFYFGKATFIPNVKFLA